jgi:RNA polymerase sigma-70 factor, ECF subfamily
VQDERVLVERAQQNDQEAFAELYEKYFDKIYRYIVFKIGDKFEAEDMTQQVFLKVLRSIRSFKWQEAPFSAWLYRIAHNQIVDHLRQHTRRPTSQLEEAVTDCKQTETSPQQLIETRLDMEELVTAAKKLTPAQNEVIALRFSSDLPIAEVARLMGKSQGAIKALQHSAILALRRIMLPAGKNE